MNKVLKKSNEYDEVLVKVGNYKLMNQRLRDLQQITEDSSMCIIKGKAKTNWGRQNSKYFLKLQL